MFDEATKSHLHGGCALLKTTQNGVLWTVMIDCGHKNNDRGQWFPGDYLRSQGIYTIDLLVITNLDEDHVSGLPNILKPARSMSPVNITRPPPKVRLVMTLKLFSSSKACG